MRTKLILSFISLFVFISCEKESFDINDINGEIIFLSRRIPNSASWNLFKMDSNGSKQEQITDLTIMCTKPVLSNSEDKLLFVHYNDNNEYELYDMCRVHLDEWSGHVKGKAMLIFIPDKPGPKKEIPM